MLRMSTVELGNPISQIVPVKAGDVPLHLRSGTALHIDGSGSDAFDESVALIQLARVSGEQCDSPQALEIRVIKNRFDHP